MRGGAADEQVTGHRRIVPLQQPGARAEEWGVKSLRVVRRHTKPEALVLAVMALVLGLGCLATAAFSGAQDAPRGMLVVVGLMSVGIAVALVRSARPVGPAALHAAVVLLTLMRGLMVAEAATERGLLLSALGFSWMAVYAGFFFGARVAYAYASLVAVVLGAALLAARAPTDISVWITISATVWVAILILTRLSARLRTAAHHDDLTGVLNRAGFFIEGARRRVAAERQALSVAIIVIDLDDFKRVNDRDGHAAGDELLVALTAAWAASLRPADVLARFGGDEFVLLVSGPSEAAVGALLDRLVAAHPAAWTAGTTMCRGEETLAYAIERADARLYEAKAARRDAVDRRAVVTAQA